MEGLKLLSLLHTVGLFFFFPFQVLSVLFTKPTDSTRERERESERARPVLLKSRSDSRSVSTTPCRVTPPLGAREREAREREKFY